MRVMNEVYCKEEHWLHVQEELYQMYERLRKEHPEYEFDVSFGSENWEVCDEDV